MNAALLAIGALGCFTLAYRYYARWLERRVYEMDTDEPTPAHTTPDGVDFVPCQKHVLFGHHFCSVAGAAPIVGPAIAVIWGWLPALVWVVFGTIFIGAVHDYGALALSAKRGGRTMGDLAGEILGDRARVWFLSIIVLLTWVVIAVFGWLIAKLFVGYPASVIPVNFEILVAVIIGWWIYRKKGALLWPIHRGGGPALYRRLLGGAAGQPVAWSASRDDARARVTSGHVDPVPAGLCIHRVGTSCPDPASAARLHQQPSAHGRASGVHPWHPDHPAGGDRSRDQRECAARHAVAVAPAVHHHRVWRDQRLPRSRRQWHDVEAAQLHARRARGGLRGHAGRKASSPWSRCWRSPPASATPRPGRSATASGTRARSATSSMEPLRFSSRS